MKVNKDLQNQCSQEANKEQNMYVDQSPIV